MKILKSVDNRLNKRKLVLESQIFIALVRSLWLHEGFFSNLPGSVFKEIYDCKR